MIRKKDWVKQWRGSGSDGVWVQAVLILMVCVCNFRTGCTAAHEMMFFFAIIFFCGSEHWT